MKTEVVTRDNYEKFIFSDDPELRSLAEMYEDDDLQELYEEDF